MCLWRNKEITWATIWQNQQNERAPSEDSDQPGIRPVWSESSLCTQWVAKDPRFLHADSKDSYQTGRMPRLIWVFAGRTLILLVLSCRGSHAETKIIVINSDKHSRNLSICQISAAIIMWSFYTINSNTLFTYEQKWSSLGLLLFWVFLKNGSLRWNALFTVSKKVKWTVHNQLRWQYT